MAVRLTELEVRNCKAREAKYTLAAGQGLMLLVMPDGSKYWRLRYRYGGKSRMIAVGKPYPETTLKAATAKAAEMRALLAQGIDPANERRAEKLAMREQVANTFGRAADAWHQFRSKAWDAKTAEQARNYLDKDLLPKLHSRPLDLISPAELGALVAGIEARGAFDVAKKVRQWLKAIFSYSRAKAWTTNDPARDLAAIAAPAPEQKNYAYLQVEELPSFLRALDSYEGSTLVVCCAKLSLWTANRPGVTRTLRWSELNLGAALWTIQKGREGMKRGYFHLTPLPRQAVEMLREVQRITGHFDYVFVGRNDPTKPLSDGAINVMLKRIGYRYKQTAHGFRHLISTALNDQGYAEDWIERQLAHGDPDKIRGTYNKAQYLEPRRKMMQAWADYLDSLKRRESTVVPLRVA
jgi:integrase